MSNVVYNITHAYRYVDLVNKCSMKVADNLLGSGYQNGNFIYRSLETYKVRCIIKVNLKQLVASQTLFGKVKFT